MPENDNPAVVLVSGGVDSTVLLHYVRSRLARAPLYALSFNYGQRHSRELECAKAQAALAGVDEFQVIDIGFMGALLGPGTTLVAGGADVPDLADVPEADRAQPPTYVPNRNMMLLSMAAAFAEARGVADVFYGAQAQDEYGYWDCTTAFLERINAVLALNRKQPVTVHAPFVNHAKADNVQLGLELGVDFSRTWTCYRGHEIACGTCPSCVERRKAFESAGAEDPLPCAG